MAKPLSHRRSERLEEQLTRGEQSPRTDSRVRRIGSEPLPPAVSHRTEMGHGGHREVGVAVHAPGHLVLCGPDHVPPSFVKLGYGAAQSNRSTSTHGVRLNIPRWQVTASVAVVAALFCGHSTARAATLDSNAPGGVTASAVTEDATAASAQVTAPQEHHEHAAAGSGVSAGAAVGRQVFAQNCARCHGGSAEGKIGPKLAGTAHSRAEIQHTVTHGIPPKMPAFAKKLSPEQIAAVAAFVKLLGSQTPGQAPGHEHQHEQPRDRKGHEHGEGAMSPMPGMSRIVGQEMSRHGSGTSWLPESSPMWAKHTRRGSWMLMQHGNLVPMYDAQGGPRGVSRPVASNWYMLMGHRPVGKGELMLRTMLTLEPATFGNNGMPQLFQTGEGLIDRQHAHDLFMEIAAQYSHPLSRELAAYLYLAPVGEPALGPTAFMHRVSAMEIPTAPLIHHWTDSTHISYGVATAGIQSNLWKLEGSWFNGHEPDDKRWAIDSLALNSYSGRLSYAPSRDWVFQVSRGHLDNPEINYPEEHQGGVDRTTLSASYNRPLPRGNWATTVAWGRNKRDEGRSDGFLIESNYNWADRHYLFGRIENVEKNELFPASDPRSEQQFKVNAFSLGYARDIGRSRGFETALGAMATVSAKPDALDRVYGKSPVSVQVFLRIRPRRMSMEEHAAHAGHGANGAKPAGGGSGLHHDHSSLQKQAEPRSEGQERPPKAAPAEDRSGHRH
jgi:mono/diheme cytochrome c family protein